MVRILASALDSRCSCRGSSTQWKGFGVQPTTSLSHGRTVVLVTRRNQQIFSDDPVHLLYYIHQDDDLAVLKHAYHNNFQFVSNDRYRELISDTLHPPEARAFWRDPKNHFPFRWGGAG